MTPGVQSGTRSDWLRWMQKKGSLDLAWWQAACGFSHLFLLALSGFLAAATLGLRLPRAYGESRWISIRSQRGADSPLGFCPMGCRLEDAPTTSIHSPNFSTQAGFHASGSDNLCIGT